MTVLLNLQLLPPPGKAPSCGLGREVPWKMGMMYRQHTAKEASTSAWCLWKDGTEGLMVEQRWGGQGPHQSCLSSVQEEYLCNTLSPCNSFEFSHTHKTQSPANYIVCLSEVLHSARTICNRKVLHKNSSCSSYILKKQIQMWLNILNNSFS